VRGCCLFERPHHQRVARLLDSLNNELLARTHCYFGGGTAIVLMLGEYRESVDVDLLCADADGYRELRNIVNENSLGALVQAKWHLPRGVRADRYGIRTFCEVEGIPIKLEIVREDRIQLAGQVVATWQAPTLSRIDLYAEKLLANADRWADRSTASRDAIDLAMMVHHWGPIPDEAWAKARRAYGASVDRALASAVALLHQEGHLQSCLGKMGMAADLSASILEALGPPKHK
jgi:Nucleotidyl transferase AbiEii toxin, Type IV TA system